MHKGQLALVREKSGQNKGFPNGELRRTLGINFEDQPDVGPINRQTFINYLLNRVLLGLLVVLKSPDLGILNREIFIGVPAAVL